MHPAWIAAIVLIGLGDLLALLLFEFDCSAENPTAATTSLCNGPIGLLPLIGLVLMVGAILLARSRAGRASSWGGWLSKCGAGLGVAGGLIPLLAAIGS